VHNDSHGKLFLFSVCLLLFIVTAACAFAVTFIEKGSVWRYDDSGTDRGTGWRPLNYDDSSWNTGPAELGYGDGDESTTISYGGDPNNKYPCYYFRQKFNVSDTAAIENFKLGVNYDDGFVAYINNTEAARSSNMPAGAIGYDSLASPDHEGGSFESFSVDTTVLTAGQNILAIEVHQQSISSSDLSFDAELT